MNKKTHPINEGWVHMDATLKSSDPLTEQEKKNIATFGQPENYEIGFMSQNGKKFKCATRHVSRQPKQPEPAA